MRTTMAVAAVAVMAVASAGCASKPTMTLHGVRVTQASFAGVGLTMTMSVRNDNSFDVMVRDVRADAIIARRYRLPQVQISPNKWLPADQTTLVEIPITIPWQDVVPLVETTLGSPFIEYQAWGSANVTATRALEIDVDDYNFEQQGWIARDQLVRAAGRAVFGR